jgi:glycosyltransferase involved in cell wall biosynthesis
VGGIDARVFEHRDWSVSGTQSLIRRVNAAGPDLVHIQYPMIVGWRSLGPHLFGFRNSAPLVVTLHEFTTFMRLRRLSLSAFGLAARRLVFTTNFEREGFLRLFPRFAAKTVIVPIGSNIPFLDPKPGPEPTIVHFGQIKPDRGLEDFLGVAKMAARHGRSWRFQVIGAPVAWAREFVTQAQSAAGSNVQWRLNLGEQEAAEALRSSTVAYLPYPDGVSERRGSLIAALGNGLPVVTTPGAFQTEDLARVTLLTPGPEQAYAEIGGLMDNLARRDAMRAAALSFVEKFAWPRIADSYRAIYQRSLQSLL